MYTLEMINANLSTLLSIHSNQYCLDYRELESEIEELRKLKTEKEALGIATHKNGFDYTSRKGKRYFLEEELTGIYCSGCKEVLGVGNFHRNKSTHTGYNNLCKSCNCQYQKEWLAHKSKRKLEELEGKLNEVLAIEKELTKLGKAEKARQIKTKKLG